MDEDFRINIFVINSQKKVKKPSDETKFMHHITFELKMLVYLEKRGLKNY